MSVRSDIRDAVAAVIAGLGETVRKRKIPALVEGEASVVGVSVGSARYEPALSEDDDAWFGYYAVAATIVTRTGMTLSDFDDEDRAEAIRRAVTWPALEDAGLDVVDDCDPDPSTPYAPEMLDANLNYTPVAFTVRTLESRE